MKEKLVSFAQEREDIILYHLLHDVAGESIRWIDVGANDPIDISVTKFFSFRGGCGINIEPQPDLVTRLNADRKRDINLASGISNLPGEMTLHGTGGLATFQNNQSTRLFSGARTVPVVTLRDVCEKYISPGSHTHFLKIDVEGWERQCIESMDFHRYRPWLLCVEAVSPVEEVPSHGDWEPLLLEQNYVLAGTSGVNRYYAAGEKKELPTRFLDAFALESVYDVVDYKPFHETCRFPLDITGFESGDRILLYGDEDCAESYEEELSLLGIETIRYDKNALKEDSSSYDMVLITTSDSIRAIDYRQKLISSGEAINRIVWRPTKRVSR